MKKLLYLMGSIEAIIGILLICVCGACANDSEKQNFA